MLEIGTMLSGRYEVLKRVGSGGMADVYMAKDHKLNRNVAVKVLKSEYVEDEKFLKKFETEAQAVARLSHPNIVNVYDVGIEDGINYIVMELAEGMTLKEYIRRKGYLSPKETVEISLQIASAISHAHKNHIIHRDIKPQNILVSEIGNVKVTDFGIAKATSSNTVTSTATAMGSVHYISPEQAKGRFCDEKSDIYSLGITMYEMVTGHVPFDHENGVTIALMHLQNEITPPSQIRDGIPDSLEKIILKCTMKKPEDRYQTADELIADLKLVFEDTSGEYVGIVPTIDDSPTIMIDQNELTQRINTPKNDSKIQQEESLKAEEENAYLDEDDTQPVEDSDSNAYLEEDDEEEETGMNSKIEKLVIVLAAVVGAIILISIVVFVVKSSGLFKSGKSTTQSTIAATTEAKHHNTTEKYTVDNYIGLSLEAAREAIDNKFKINVTEEYSDTYAKGLVMQQDPESDTVLEEGKTIKLVVSKGQKIEDKVSVPDVRSKTKSGAQSNLKAAVFKVSIKEAYSDDVAKGEVISQTPSHGSKVSKNTTVVITVSKGKKEDQTVSVPNLRYYTESEASQELQRFGLSLGSVLTEYSDSVEKGLVIRQRISSGSKVKKGTAVGIYVSLGPRQTATTADEESTTTDEE